MAKYKRIFLLFFIGSFLTNMQALAQDTIPNYDTSYIESYRDYMVITLVSVWNANNVRITDNHGDDVSFATDMPWHFGFAVDYKWITLELTRNLDKKYAETARTATEAKSFGFGLTGRKFWFRNFWKKYKGYYMQNPDYFNPNFDPLVDEYPERSDLETTIYFANLNYGFNYRRFSNTASLWQLEKQKKSAGSFTAGLSFAYTRYGADSSLIIPEWRENFEEDAIIKSYNLTLFGVNGGYLHTFSMFRKKNLFISLALIPGLSYQVGKAVVGEEEIEVKRESIGTQTELRFVLGYNHKRWYTSFSGNFYLISNNFAEKNTIFQDYSFLRFMLGYKIKLRKTKSRFLKELRL